MLSSVMLFFWPAKPLRFWVPTLLMQFQVTMWPLGYEYLLGLWNSYYEIASSVAEVFCHGCGLCNGTQGKGIFGYCCASFRQC